MSLNTILSGYTSYKGVKLYIKTNLGPEILAYDSDTPDSAPGFIKAGVRVTDREGNDVASYGGQPRTNYIVLGAIALMLTTGTTLLIRGLKK